MKLSLISTFLLLLIGGCSTEKTKNQVGIARLLEGNKRFVENKQKHIHQDNEARIESINEQKPFAVIVTCSDSRVSPSVIFDHGIGDLFIIRTAGNMIDEIELASIEYAVEHLNVELVMVMGHEECGAITAFVENKHEDGHIKNLIEKISAEVEEKEAIKDASPQKLNRCIIANVKHQIKYILKESKLINEKIRKRELNVYAAEYSQKTGIVKILNL